MPSPINQSIVVLLLIHIFVSRPNQRHKDISKPIHLYLRFPQNVSQLQGEKILLVRVSWSILNLLYSIPFMLSPQYHSCFRNHLEVLLVGSCQGKEVGNGKQQMAEYPSQDM